MSFEAKSLAGSVDAIIVVLGVASWQQKLGRWLWSLGLAEDATEGADRAKAQSHRSLLG